MHCHWESTTTSVTVAQDFGQQQNGCVNIVFPDDLSMPLHVRVVSLFVLIESNFYSVMFKYLF